MIGNGCSRRSWLFLAQTKSPLRRPSKTNSEAQFSLKASCVRNKCIPLFNASNIIVDLIIMPAMWRISVLTTLHWSLDTQLNNLPFTITPEVFCLFLQFVWYRRTNNCKYGNLFWKQVQVIKMALIPFWHLSNTHIERNCVTCKFFLSCRWKVMGLFPNAYFYNLEISTAQLWKNSQKWLFFLFI